MVLKTKYDPLNMAHDESWFLGFFSMLTPRHKYTVSWELGEIGFDVV